MAAVEGGETPASGDASPAPRGSDDEGATEAAAPVEGEVSDRDKAMNTRHRVFHMLIYNLLLP